jgi:ribose 5-phosphate isomerase B
MCAHTVADCFAPTSEGDASTPLRIVVGSDDAGYDYKEALKGDLNADSRR